MKILVVLNPRGGTLARLGAAGSAMVEDAFERHGVTPTIKAVRGRDMAEAIRGAIDQAANSRLRSQ